ncbi:MULTISPECIES: hypothetical protein [unclassified Streptomyces]|uniref:hypothetical protein n=1 Tax=unclassified Streptomyces TaxID=2593676 RepID=UPI00165576F8|nr:hypothetical protein [Streptomyces sp. CB02980]MCB8901995.1 hypothetical protein [Streptomyces sp. CB02980]
MTDLFAPDSPSGSDSFDEEETVRPGPFWRHALWVVGVSAAAVAAGWLTSLFRIGPEEYGLPPAAPGALWPYLVAWAAIGLAVAAVLRATAAKVPVYAPGRIAAGLTYLGTRISLGWRPEAPPAGAMAAAALIVAAVWCAIALRPHRAKTETGAEV